MAVDVEMECLSQQDLCSDKGAVKLGRHATRSNDYGYRRQRRKVRKGTLIWIVVLLALLITGYHYRAHIYAFVDHFIAGPPDGGTALPPTDPEPEEEEPAEQEPEPEDPAGEEAGGEEPGEETEPGPLPEGELPQAADADYLLVLVTKQMTLGRYTPSDLVAVPLELAAPGRENWGFQPRREACDQLAPMAADARAEGVALFVNSAYRSYDTQERLFWEYAAIHGEAEANTFSARPGQSEHQLGTAIDFGGTPYDFTDSFGETPAGIWLAQNAHRYGFAMSYPPSTQAITGYIYEPWHFRYIGVEAAAEWKESGLVLCQFLAQKPQDWLE